MNINGERILIATSSLRKNPSANGIISNNIINHIKTKKNHVICISTSKKPLKSYITRNNVLHYEIKPSAFTIISTNKSVLGLIINKLFRLFRIIKNTILFLNFPNYDLLYSIRHYKIVQKIVKTEQVNNLIFIHKPYVNISTALRLKRKYRNLNIIIYLLDPIESIKRPFFVPSNVYRFFIIKTYKRIFENFDNIIIPFKNSEFITSKLKKKYNNNLIFTGYPTYNNNLSCKGNYVRNLSKIRFLYAGTLDEKYRNPKFLFYLLDKLSEIYLEVELSIFGSNKLFLKPTNINDNFKITFEGFISYEKLIKKYEDFDILVNISNYKVNSVPSKIFELISTGKPVLNIYRFKDETLTYFEKYPLAINIKESYEPQMNIFDVNELLIESLGKKIDKDLLNEFYKEYTLDYTIDIIKSLINKIS